MMRASIVVFVCLHCVSFIHGKYKFPRDFKFGVASSSYQIEGGHDADGKGINVFDYYTAKYPERFENDNGNIAADSYHKYKEDVRLAADLGVQFYRFSISWSRILPKGYAYEINEAGINYYNSLIDSLLEAGIEPMVSMYHWDLPMPLQEIGGWTNPLLVNYFEDYAAVLFRAFGDRVKWWITINHSKWGYGDDDLAPYLNYSGITDYLCNHVQVLGHARVYHLYDSFFRRTQNGKVGLVVDGPGKWPRPATDSKEDIEAADRARLFTIGLSAGPIYHPDGDYPDKVKEIVRNASLSEGFLRSRLPSFSPDEVDYIQGTYDFMGLNLYTSELVKHANRVTSGKPSLQNDMAITTYHNESWKDSNSKWLKVAPEGVREVLKWVKDNYDDPEIIITENGFSDKGEINDLKRIQYLQKYLSTILEAIHEDRVNLKGYAVWSLLDNFEWSSGYSARFGLYHVDFDDANRTRTPKKSAKWYKHVIEERQVIDIEKISSRLKGDL